MQPNSTYWELFSAQTASGTAGTRDLSSFDNVTFYVTGTGTTSSGVVTIEEAPDVGYTGTWSSITTVNASDVTGGATKGVHLTVSAYKAVRARISTVIGGGGSISVALIAH